MTNVDLDWIKFWGVAVAAFIALVGTIISLWRTSQTQRSIEELKIDSQKELETLKARLDEKKSEKNARRDYLYDAKKRLYQECEPLFFQQYEMAKRAIKRINSLARTAKDGDLEPGQGWLRSDGYYSLSTIYYLLTPLTTFHLIKERLTLIDLTVDPKIYTQYVLTRTLYHSFTSDFLLAKQEPVIFYSPNVSHWDEKRRQDPSKYWRQGVVIGRLEVAVSQLIVKEDERSRSISFGEFEEKYRADETFQQTIGNIFDIFIDFHPKTRPIFWRMLIAQYYIYKSILCISEMNYENYVVPSEIIRDIHDDEMSNFDWRQSHEDSYDFTETFKVAKSYLDHEISLEIGSWIMRPTDENDNKN